MKTMTCNDLGGVCDEKFHAETFEEMGEKFDSLPEDN